MVQLAFLSELKGVIVHTKVRESLFALMREYHEISFSASSKISNKEINGLKKELETIQEQVITTVLSFIYDKSEFVDSVDELNSFQGKVKASLFKTKSENNDKSILLSKIGQLLKILQIAKGVSLS